MFSEFMIRAMLAGMGVAAMTGILGCFVVWRRMAYFGDALSHASVLGVAISLGLGVSVYFGVLGIAILMAVLLWALSHQRHSVDTLLGVLSHGALAVGLIAAATIGGGFSIEAVLFGDILALSWGDVAAIWGGAVVVSGFILWRWSRLITATLGSDLAASTGVDAEREFFYLTLALAILVGLALKVVGAILITALLIIPAASARGFVRTPEAMAGLAVLFGASSAVLGLIAAYTWDWPAGPSMVAVACGFFALSQGVRGRFEG